MEFCSPSQCNFPLIGSSAPRLGCSIHSPNSTCTISAARAFAFSHTHRHRSSRFRLKALPLRCQRATALTPLREEALLVPDGSILAAFYGVLFTPPCGALGGQGTNPSSGGRCAKFAIPPCRFQQAVVKEMAVDVLAAAVS